MPKILTITQLLKHFSDNNDVNLNYETGNPEVSISNVSPLSSVKKDSLVFANSAKDIINALNSQCSAICTTKKGLSDFNASTDTTSTNKIQNSEKAIFTSKNPHLTIAITIQDFFADPFRPNNTQLIHPTVIIPESAQIGENVSIGAYSVIGENAVIKDNTTLKEHCVIQEHAIIGENTKLFPFVLIGRHCILGNNCVIQSMTVIGSEGFGYAHSKEKAYHVPHKGKVVIEDNVEIGASCNIDRSTYGETVIGKNSIFDNKIHIAHNVTIGENAIITAGFIVAGSTNIGKRFVAGGRAGAVGHINIADNVTLSNSAVVEHNIKEPGMYGGSPAIPFSIHKRNYMTAPKLSEIRKNVTALMKKVFPIEK